MMRRIEIILLRFKLRRLKRKRKSLEESLRKGFPIAFEKVNRIEDLDRGEFVKIDRDLEVCESKLVLKIKDYEI
jgi:hypothetical protein